MNSLRCLILRWYNLGLDSLHTAIWCESETKQCFGNTINKVELDSGTRGTIHSKLPGIATKHSTATIQPNSAVGQAGSRAGEGADRIQGMGR